MPPSLAGEAQSYRRWTTANRAAGSWSTCPESARTEVDIAPIDGKLLRSPAPGQPVGAVSRPNRAVPRGGRNAGLVPGAAGKGAV